MSEVAHWLILIGAIAVIAYIVITHIRIEKAKEIEYEKRKKEYRRIITGDDHA